MTAVTDAVRGRAYGTPAAGELAPETEHFLGGQFDHPELRLFVCPLLLLTEIVSLELCVIVHGFLVSNRCQPDKPFLAHLAEVAGGFAFVACLQPEESGAVAASRTPRAPVQMDSRLATFSVI